MQEDNLDNLKNEILSLENQLQKKKELMAKKLNALMKAFRIARKNKIRKIDTLSISKRVADLLKNEQKRTFAAKEVLRALNEDPSRIHSIRAVLNTLYQENKVKRVVIGRYQWNDLEA